MVRYLLHEEHAKPLKIIEKGVSMKRIYVVFIGAILIAAVAATFVTLYEKYPTHYREIEIQKDVYPYKFIFFGDCRPPYEFEKREDLKLTDTGYPEVFIKMISMMNEEDPLFIVGGGDYVLRGLEEDFQTFSDIADAFEPPVFYVCGNHDNSRHYEQYLGERVYSFSYKNSLFVVLDNSGEILDEKQLSFLEKQLERDFEYKFVFVHWPPFDPTGGGHHMIAPESFEVLLLENKVDITFFSHLHTYFEEKLKDTIYIISGGAGAPMGENDFYHYIVVEVGDQVTYTVVKVEAECETTNARHWTGSRC